VEDNEPASRENFEQLNKLVSRWKRYIDEGVFELSVPLDTPLAGSEDATLAEFWTGPWPYWYLESQAPELFKELKGSDLVIFKVSCIY
jgi:hypothetical protein